MNRRTLVIAEVGVNHDGDIEKAKRLIDVAAQAGADLVKFQTFRADRLATAQAPNADYQLQAEQSFGSQYQMLKALELSLQMHEELIAHCSVAGIEFFSTGFDEASNAMLFGLGIRRFKIPSGEITNLPYLRHVGSFGSPVILSTGMATLGEIEAALTVLEIAGMSRRHITVLHCNTEYPTPMQDVNLRAMLGIRDALGVTVGYSDHTRGIEIPVAAVALGATVIEKHLTLDRNLPGPDHRASLEPHEFTAMVKAIRNIEQALGDGIKRLTPSETRNKPVVRKSLVACRTIKAGEAFTAENLTTKRAGNGISAMRWDEVLGKKAQRDFAADELIED